MSFPEIPNELAQKLGGPIGGAIAMLFLRGDWKRRLAMAAAACPLSWYGAPHLIKWIPLSEGFAGLLLGLFGMAAVSKVFEALNQVDLYPLLNSWLPVRKNSNDPKE